MQAPLNAGINLVTIIRRWLHENFQYKFKYSNFGIASVVNNKASLHISLNTRRVINERETFVTSVLICWFDDVGCVVLGREVGLVNVGINLSDPEFFDKFKKTLTEYLTAFEKAGYVFPRK